ncbi:hypothetical protein ACVWZR_010234 [Bradyrhizobium sp. i1.3.1]
MSMIETTGTILDWDVTTVKRAGLSRDLPSGNPDLMWVANSSTLIYGERDAILVDTFLTAGQSKKKKKKRNQKKKKKKKREKQNKKKNKEKKVEDVAGLGRVAGAKSDRDLRHAWPR